MAQSGGNTGQLELDKGFGFMEHKDLPVLIDASKVTKCLKITGFHQTFVYKFNNQC